MSFHKDDLPGNRLPAFRSLARGFCAEGGVAKANGQFRRAARCYVDVVRLGYAVAHGGLMVDAYVGIAIEESGLYALSEMAADLDLTTLESREIIGCLLQVDADWEPGMQFIDRDERWCVHVLGWQARFDIAMSKFGCDKDKSQSPFVGTLRRHQCWRRLLILELALNAYEKDNHRMPTSLSELSPTYLSEVPHDPYSNSTFIYQSENGIFSVVSVGSSYTVGDRKRISRKDHQVGGGFERCLSLKSFLELDDAGNRKYWFP